VLFLFPALVGFWEDLPFPVARPLRAKSRFRVHSDEPTANLRVRAQITVQEVKMRSLPDESASVLRVAEEGEKFQFVPDTRFRGWFNVVDAATQQDYWLPGNTFKIVEAAETKQTPAKKEKAPQPPARQKPKAKRGKNRRN